MGELLIFCCCLVSVDFLSFLLYFTLFFVNFWGLSLPCHSLCCLLFVFLLFVFLFFPSWIFWGFFVSLIALGTFSLRLVMSPLGVGCTAPPLRGQVLKGSKLYN